MNLTELNFPKPSNQEIKISNQLKTQIREKIEQDSNQAISFGEFMAQALFSELGYYKNTLQKFGQSGDFITAPELSEIFAYALKPLIKQSFKKLQSHHIFEFGAGSGALMLSLFQLFEKTNTPIEKYYVLELSADLKQRQFDLIQKNAPQFINQIIWLSRLPCSSSSEKLKAVILANELLDTFSFDCFIQRKKGKNPTLLNTKECFERKVAISDKGEFYWKNTPLNQSKIEKIENLNQSFKAEFNPDFFYFDDGYKSEFSPDYSLWLKSIKPSFSQAICLWIDYGLSRKEYYSPIRNKGTLRCYYRHRLHQEPFYLVGMNDITAHVHFSDFLLAARKNKIDFIHYTSQGQFMLNCDFQTLFNQTQNIKEQIKLSSEFKQLTLPSEMGEIFKMMILAFSDSADNQSHFFADFDFKSRDLSYQL